MGFIALEGMHFYAFHGFYEEEQLIGTDYLVDVYIEKGFTPAASKDALENTINYETVYLLVKLEMNKKRKLLETLAIAIIQSLKHQFGQMQGVRVRIRKMRPPLGGMVSHAMVEESANFKKKCGSCNNTMVCYSDGTCWCNQVSIFPKTRELISDYYRGCLCESCLGEYEK